MSREMLHIFQQERRGLMMPDNAFYIEEKVALFLVIKAVFTAERILLGNSGQREWLTWKAGEQYVMLRDEFRVGAVGPDVTNHEMLVIIAGEVRLVSSLGILVPFACENALASNSLETKSQAANSCKKIDEPEFWLWLFYHSGLTDIPDFVADEFGNRATVKVPLYLATGFACFPSELFHTQARAAKLRFETAGQVMHQAPHG